MGKVLFFRSNGDFAMQYASHWLGVGVEEAAKRGYQVIDLIQEATTFAVLKETIESEDVTVAFLGGHGASNVFTGYEQQVVLRACENDQVMVDTISHFLSCSVGQELLPSIIEKGGVFTVGYQEDFQFMVNTEYDIKDDPYAEPFKDVTVAIINAILDGKKLKEVWDAGIAKCDEWIAKLWDRPELDWAEVISTLEHDRNAMIGLGDNEAYVLPPRQVTLNAPGIVAAIAFFLLITH
jgi:hypothetical protein